ncbi:MAG: hypothetical protein AAGA76_13190 [Pseudomonadota bacterium]
MRKLVLAFTVLLLTLQTVAADNTVFINRWYEALRTVNRPTFERLLADSAMIDLKELGIVQNKNEFIESLDNWENVAGDVQISTTTVTSANSQIVVDVCYEFPSNSFTNRETFFLGGGLITGQEQEKLRDEC